MEHDMKVQPMCFKEMKKGTKIIEARLYDQKRKSVHVGDNIIFYKEPELKESIKTIVTDVKLFKSFKDLVDNYTIEELIAKDMSKEAYLSLLKSFYTEEEEKKFGCIAIKFKLV